MLGQFITHCEDSLTASVFTHLLHLPSEVFWKILSSAAYTDQLPRRIGEPSQFDFWPKWKAAGTQNSHYVEPDVFIRFPEFDLIIEAKRWDERQQSSSQWMSELIAYANEYGEEKRPVKMIALGGLHDVNDEEISHDWKFEDDHEKINDSHRFVCPVHMCRWDRLLHQCRRLQNELVRLEYPTSQTFATRRILDHVIELFNSHGYSTGLWFTDFNFEPNRLSSIITPHLTIFQNRSRQLFPL